MLIGISVLVFALCRLKNRSKKNQGVDSAPLNTPIAPNTKTETAQGSQPSCRRLSERLLLDLPSYATPTSSVYQPLICSVFIIKHSISNNNYPALFRHDFCSLLLLRFESDWKLQELTWSKIKNSQKSRYLKIVFYV